uniref:(northern house mosquito) hypothetical protein n=1 Tax=Culex pipiens TaxID=7175 RepID=A0A8D8CBU8_CULPI
MVLTILLNRMHLQTLHKTTIVVNGALLEFGNFPTCLRPLQMLFQVFFPTSILKKISKNQGATKIIAVHLKLKAFNFVFFYYAPFRYFAILNVWTTDQKKPHNFRKQIIFIDSLIFC